VKTANVHLGMICMLAVVVAASYAGAAAAGQADPAAPAVIGASVDTVNHVFPACANVIDVTKAPYNAKGDGKTDDTAALQQALKDHMGRHRIIYLPNGTYLVSSTLMWTKKDAGGKEAWGFTWIQGQNQARTIIRLKDNTFTDPNKPQSIMWGGGFGSADWFHNYVQDLTFDVGRGNPGAIGLQFYSNNQGAVRNLTIVSQDGKGRIGLDLGYNGLNGPLLARNITIRGFDVGVSASGGVNSQTFEHITVTGQGMCGFLNKGQPIAIRGLVSENACTAVKSAGLLALLDARLVGRGAEAAKLPAIEMTGNGPLFARGIATTGYARAIACKQADNAPPTGANVKEYISSKATAPFGSPAASLDLPVKETPETPWDDPKTWAIPDAFGADPSGKNDSSDAVQKAIDSGATTVFFPGFYSLTKPVTVRGKVRRILGTGAWVDYSGASKPDFIIADGDAPIVFMEHFGAISAPPNKPNSAAVVVQTDRTVVFRSLGTRIALKGRGDVYIEDAGAGDLQINPGQRLWARQLNIENQGTHLTNNGGMLWVLGYKTERGGTLIHTLGGGRTELFGTFSYTTTAGKLAPMFVNEDSTVFAFFNEVCYTGDPFATLIREVRNGQEKTINRSDGGVTPYVGYLNSK